MKFKIKTTTKQKQKTKENKKCGMESCSLISFTIFFYFINSRVPILSCLNKWTVALRHCGALSHYGRKKNNNKSVLRSIELQINRNKFNFIYFNYYFRFAMYGLVIGWSFGLSSDFIGFVNCKYFIMIQRLVTQRMWQSRFIIVININGVNRFQISSIQNIADILHFTLENEILEFFQDEKKNWNSSSLETKRWARKKERKKTIESVFNHLKYKNISASTSQPVYPMSHAKHAYIRRVFSFLGNQIFILHFFFRCLRIKINSKIKTEEQTTYEYIYIWVYHTPAKHWHSADDPDKQWNFCWQHTTNQIKWKI